jgi:hypothetical protein
MFEDSDGEVSVSSSAVEPLLMSSTNSSSAQSRRSKRKSFLISPADISAKRRKLIATGL